MTEWTQGFKDIKLAEAKKCYLVWHESYTSFFIAFKYKSGKWSTKSGLDITEPDCFKELEPPEIIV